MLMTPLYAFAPYKADPGPRITSMRPRSSRGSAKAPQVWRIRCGGKIAPVLQDQHLAAEQDRVCKNPRALTLKSFTPLCVTSSPGTPGQREDVARDRQGAGPWRAAPRPPPPGRRSSGPGRPRHAFHEHGAQFDWLGVEHGVGRGAGVPAVTVTVTSQRQTDPCGTVEQTRWPAGTRGQDVQRPVALVATERPRP